MDESEVRKIVAEMMAENRAKMDAHMATIEFGELVPGEKLLSIDDVNKIVAAAIAKNDLKIRSEFGAAMEDWEKRFA